MSRRDTRRRVTRWIAAALAGTGVLSVAWGMSPMVQNRLNAVFDDLNADTPGCVAGVVRNGDLVYANAFGMADLGQHIPMSTDTVLEIGSLSKEFTAASILLLAQERRLSLDDAVSKYVPDFPNYSTPITIRELMNHTSGVRDVISLMKASGIPTIDGATQQDALAMIERQRYLNFPPDTEWEYSNSGYVLLAAVVRGASGVPLPEFEQKEIFRPLGMKNTSIDADPRRVIPNRAMSYERTEGGGYRLAASNWVQFGDGAVNTTIRDFAFWVRNFEDPTVGGQQLIRALETPGRLADGRSTGYGGGLFIGTYPGLERISHAGSWQGFRTEFELFPERHLGIVVLCNGADTRPNERAAKMGDLLIGIRLQSNADKENRNKRGNSLARRLLRYAGWYASSDHRGLWDIAVGDGRIRMGPARDEVGGWHGEVDPDSYVSDIGKVRVYREQGLTRLRINASGQVLSRCASAGKGDRSGLPGAYRSAALQVVWKVTSAADDDLVLHVMGANPNRLDTDFEYRLRPLAKNVFAAGPYIVEFGRDQFWLFAPRASGIHFVRRASTHDLSTARRSRD
jgi:CubicO group peptidase (beta-lactamase class C family)